MSIILVFIVTLLLTFMLPNSIINENWYQFSLFGVYLITTIYLIISRIKKKIVTIVLIGLFIRCAVLLIDLYIPSINIFGSGDDTEYFHNASLAIAQGLMPASEGRTFYVIFLSSLYVIIGDNRLVAQFFNVFLWCVSTVFLYKSIRLITSDNRVLYLSVIIFSFLPNSIFMSSILLRESLIIFFLVISFYNFIKWYIKNNARNLLLSIILILGAMLFHAGMVGVLIAYLIVLGMRAIYSSNSKNRMLLITLVPMIVLILGLNSELLLTKFESLSDEGLEGLTITNRGGSAYLQQFEGYSGVSALLIAPLKIIYFMFSPMPWDWRGGNDLFAFMSDSIIYILMFWAVLYNLFTVKGNAKTKVVVCCILLISIFVYAYGNSNSGTAMRHRNKLLVLFLMSWPLIKYKFEGVKNVGKT